MASAYDYALNLLTARPYTIRNLKRKLVQKVYSPGEIEATVDRLIASGLLDDKRYAEQFARGRLLGPGASKRRLRQQLYQRGIPNAVADPAIEAVVTDESIDFTEVIEKDARKKIATLGDLEPIVIKRRLFSHLARRGYDIDDINAVMKKLLKA